MLPVSVVNAIVPSTMTIPPCTVQCIAATLEMGTVLIEPIEGISKHLFVARSFSATNKGLVVIQVMNTGSQPITLHKHQKMAKFTPQRFVGIIEQGTLQLDSAQSDDIRRASDNLSTQQLGQLRMVLSKYKHLFVSKKQELGRTSLVKHSITTESSPIKQPPQHIPHALRKVVKTEVQSMLANKVIRPSTSAWSSPIVLVQKKDKTWRFSIDFRRLNAVTVKDAYPLLQIDDSLAGVQYFTTLDLAYGFWQMEMEDKDKEKQLS